MCIMLEHVQIQDNTMVVWQLSDSMENLFGREVGFSDSGHHLFSRHFIICRIWIHQIIHVCVFIDV